MNDLLTLGFKDRHDAGRRMAEMLRGQIEAGDALILALPRGGVPVAVEIARALGRPFDVLIVRKLGVPHHEELAMGAIASGGIRVLSEELIKRLGISASEVQAVIARESRELTRREKLYGASHGHPQVANREVVLVDDGVATGATMSAAIRLLRHQKAARIIVAVPVAPADTLVRLRQEADEVIVALVPDPFFAVGRWYDDFSQTTDEEVQQLLAEDLAPLPPQDDPPPPPRANFSHQHALQRLREHARPITGAAADYDELLELIGDARVVLLGEASHGTHEFYRQRAQITKRLIVEKGFNVVAAEADWPDAYRINRFVRGANDDPDAVDALAGFQRFPAWMWRNAEVLDFIGWLRHHNDQTLSPNRQAGFYGLDLYSLHKSIDAVISYLERVDPPEAENAKTLYGCINRYGNDPQNYGLLAASGVGQSCQNQVVRQLVALQSKQADYLARDGETAADDYFFAEQNARLVRNAENYYRSMFRPGVSSWNARDQHMMETLHEIIGHHEEQHGTAKVVVWAHNSHLGDARATQMSRQGELNIGQLVRQAFPYHSKLIGFTTYSGTVAAAAGWHLPVERKQVIPALHDSYENLFHRVGIPNFWLDLANPAVSEALRASRLERAIGVVYLPESERQSHYFHACIADQFDAVLHFDLTRAIEPLERSTAWPSDEAPETFPAGL
jgi:erythromycin esterase-like protein/predicted phosphoribosyltransferase